MNTLFNPTVCGPLHLGHLYLILVNLKASANGQFVVLFDDIQAYWIEQLGKEKLQANCELIQQDLDWMGIHPKYVFMSQHEKELQSDLVPLGRLTNLFVVMPDDNEYANTISFERPYPYVPYQTALKVAIHRKNGVDLLIRGEDLATEFGLYCHFCTLLGFPIPKMYFIPKLMDGVSGELCDVSKTKGTHKICTYRERGFSPESLIEILSHSCLNDPTLGFELNNIKKFPRLIR